MAAPTVQRPFESTASPFDRAFSLGDLGSLPMFDTTSGDLLAMLPGLDDAFRCTASGLLDSLLPDAATLPSKAPAQQQQEVKAKQAQLTEQQPAVSGGDPSTSVEETNSFFSMPASNVNSVCNSPNLSTEFGQGHNRAVISGSHGFAAFPAQQPTSMPSYHPVVTSAVPGLPLSAADAAAATVALQTAPQELPEWARLPSAQPAQAPSAVHSRASSETEGAGLDEDELAVGLARKDFAPTAGQRTSRRLTRLESRRSSSGRGGATTVAKRVGDGAGAAAAAAEAGTSSGGDRKERKKVGRPIAFKGDPNSPELTEEERRRIKRRIANRESARRVRHKRLEVMDDMQIKIQALEESNAQLMAHLNEAEAQRHMMLTQMQSMKEQWTAATTNNAALQSEIESLRTTLQVALQQKQMEDQAADASLLQSAGGAVVATAPKLQDWPFVAAPNTFLQDVPSEV